MTRIYDNLTVTAITPEQHEKTCGYWYLVQQNHGPFTAFATQAALFRWLDERGLSCDESKLEHGKHSWQPIQGKFAENMTLSREEFDAIPEHRTVRQLDNGQYTLGKVTKDANGMRTVHYLNCNVKSRHVFPYFESDAICCGRVTPEEAPQKDAELARISGGRF